MTKGVFVLLQCALAVAVAAQPAPPPIVTSAAVDPAREINFASGVWPERVYVGQQATYQIGIFLSEAMRARLRSNPQFVPPDVRSVMAFDLPVPGRLFQRQAGGRTFDVHVYARALFPVTPGPIDIVPARLTWQVPLSNSIFAREESHNASSGSHRLVVTPPPEAGRPPGYAGAVGQLSVRAITDATPKRVGNPFTLTVTVSGVGNVALFPRPEVSLPWGHTVPGPERVRVDSTSTLVRGDKSFEWVVTPRDSGRREVPALRYPFFNPYTERYEVALTQPATVDVSSGSLVAPGSRVVATEERLPIRRAFRGDVAPNWPATPWYWLGIAMAPIPAVVARLRRRERKPSRRTAREALSRWSAAAVPDPVEVRRLTRQALRERVPSVGSAMEGAGLERALRREGVTSETARDMRRLLAEIDQALYGGTGQHLYDVARRAQDLVSRVDRESLAAVPRKSRARRGGALLLIVAAMGSLAAQGSDEIIFRESVAAWDRSDLSTAREGFSRIAQRRPRATDAWMNLGTVAWETGDTATAVRGWQRALRLEPLATDARVRLAATPNFRDGVWGDVPPVSVNWLAGLALGAWVIGWLATARGRRSRLIDTVMFAAAVFGLVALVVSERQGGRAEVVVTGATQLRDAPAMSGESGANVFVGETARVVTGQGAWSRIRFADGREGWLDAGHLASLEVPSARLLD